MKKFLFAFFSIFACMMFSSCSDEFGCMDIDYYWYFYLPENECKMMYCKLEDTKKELNKIDSDKEGYDRFVYDLLEDLHTRRDYKNTITAYIEYLDGSSEEIEASIEIPYLKGSDRITIVVPSEIYVNGIECDFYFIFYRSI